LSRWRPRGRSRWLLSRLARLSLLLLTVSVLVPGCILADAPQYVTPSQRAPVLSLYQASPTLLEILDVKTGDRVSINIPVRSEDAGEQLLGLLFSDYGTAVSREQGFSFLGPSTYDKPRPFPLVSQPLSFDTNGCHTLSLLVGHLSSFDRTAAVLNQDDIALATWMVNVNPVPGAAVDIGGCEERKAPAP
jgi:hypothetical protein